MKYEAVIGLEVHTQLKTKTKAFCGCSTEFGNEPNTQVCPVCLGFPGALPVLNKVALDYAIKVCLALNCKVQKYTKFDRKNYFYPDLPKNYQISQYDLPLSRDGFLDINLNGRSKQIGVRRIHLEEDAAKLIHQEDTSLVDFNRAGIPLLEIVSQPEINSPEEAYEYLSSLKSIIQYLDVSDCDMEKGSLRCDANISLRKIGIQELGTKTELKNMNSFKAVKSALAYEIKRQGKILDKGESIIQETRLWDEERQETIPMRTKEEAKDYRYFPEPDLPPFIINVQNLEEIKKTIPELPEHKLLRFITDYGLSRTDAKILIVSKRDAQYAEDCIKAYPDKDKKPIINWLIGPLLKEANARNSNISNLKVPAQNLVELVNFVERQEISNLSAKTVLTEMIETKNPPAKIIKERNLIQISETDILEKYVEIVLKENTKSAQDYLSGRANALMFLVGEVMKRSKSKANPKIVQEILKRTLEKSKK